MHYSSGHLQVNNPVFRRDFACVLISDLKGRAEDTGDPPTSADYRLQMLPAVIQT